MHLVTRDQSFASFSFVNMRLSIENRGSRSVPRYRDYKKDVRYVTQYSSWILSSIGIWPRVENKTGRFLQKVAILFGNLSLCFAVIPCALHIVYEEKDITIQLKLVGLLSFCVTSMIKYCALALHQTEINDCIEHVETDWKSVQLNEDHVVMLKYGEIGRNLTIICACFMYTGGLIYHTIPQLAVGKTIDQNNRTIRPLVYPTYSVFYDAQKTPIYEIVYIAHCTCGYVMYSVTCGACGLAAFFATHACGQVDIVQSRLEDLVDGKLGESNSNTDKRLADIVERHLRVLCFSATLDKILQEVCLVEFVGSTCMICLLEYYCITDWEQNNTLGLTTYILLLMSLTFNIYILCYIGELLMEKTGNIGISCFMIDWYRLPTKTMRGLILIIAMSSNPVKISAGRMVDLSLSTFGGVLKTSVAYLSFLRTAVM